MNILIVQYGNYAEAFERFRRGGPETYRDQRSSVDYVASLAPDHNVTVVAITDDEHDVELSQGLSSIGISHRALDRSRIGAMFDRVMPDLFVCATPHTGLLHEARSRRITTLPCFADIFSASGPRSVIRNLRLRFLLSAPNVPGIANHSLNASRSVAACLRYPRQKIVPWDWKRVESSYPVKTQPANPDGPTAFYAGFLSVDKGVGDCLLAVKTLHGRGIPLAMTFAGQGDLDRWQNEARSLGLADHVSFLGLISNGAVREEMSRHDFVIIPSRHSYAEGLPNTIYEGLASRSPIIISDHPAFRGRLDPDHECAVFRASDPTSLADVVQGVLGDGDRYLKLSANSWNALQKLYVGLAWPDLMDNFIRDPRNRHGWIEKHSLKALGL